MLAKFTVQHLKLRALPRTFRLDTAPDRVGSPKTSSIRQPPCTARCGSRWQNPPPRRNCPFSGSKAPARAQKKGGLNDPPFQSDLRVWACASCYDADINKITPLCKELIS